MVSENIFELFEIVDDAAFADLLEDLLDEFDVLGMDLVVVLGLLGGEDEVEGDLVGLVDDRAMAFDHPANVKFFHAGDGLEVLLGAGDEFVGGHGVGGIGPEDDDVRKHFLHVSDGPKRFSSSNPLYELVFADEIRILGAMSKVGYRKDELLLATNEDSPPRGELCPKCGTIIPDFA